VFNVDVSAPLSDAWFICYDKVSCGEAQSQIRRGHTVRAASERNGHGQTNKSQYCFMPTIIWWRVVALDHLIVLKLTKPQEYLFLKEYLIFKYKLVPGIHNERQQYKLMV